MVGVMGIGSLAAASRHQKIPDQMETDGRGEDYGIQAVEHAAMAFDELASALDAAVALDGGHCQAAQEACQGDNEGHAAGLPGGEGGQLPEARAQEARRRVPMRFGLSGS